MGSNRRVILPLQFSEVCFEAGRQQLLKRVTARIEAGSRTAILGRRVHGPGERDHHPLSGGRRAPVVRRRLQLARREQEHQPTLAQPVELVLAREGDERLPR